MSQYPVFSLDAVLRKDLAFASKVFNIHDMEYFLWVKVDTTIAKSYSLYQLDEVDSTTKWDINLNDICSHEHGRIWYKFNSIMLNRNPGQHIYRMHMVNRENETTISLYFSYIVQREDAQKSYIYMKDSSDKDVKLH